MTHCADFAHQSKRVRSVHARYSQICTLRPIVQSAPDAHFSEKVCTRSAQSVQSMHVFCTKSAKLCKPPRDFPGKTLPLVKITHLMHTGLRLKMVQGMVSTCAEFGRIWRHGLALQKRSNSGSFCNFHFCCAMARAHWRL